MFDIVISKGRVIDGSGNPWFKADLGIANGKIGHIGRIRSTDADRVIDAEGLYVTPGFIDVHTHNELTLLIKPEADKIWMGVTTEIGGLCGVSAAPVHKERFQELILAFCTVGGAYSFFVKDPAVTWNWSSFGEYMQELESKRFSVNFGSYVGHLNVRVAAMGLDNRTATLEETEDMKRLVTEAMQNGAYGLTTALSYTPADTNEIIELCKVVAQYNGHYAQHDRDNTVKSTIEGIEIAERSGVPLHLSHHTKTLEMERNLTLIGEARERGIDITMDHWFVPYGGAAGPTARLPMWALEGGLSKVMSRLQDPKTRQRIKDELKKAGKYDRPWENTVLRGVGSEPDKKYCNMDFAEIARLKGVEPFDALFDMYIRSDGQMEIDSSPTFVKDQPPQLTKELVEYLKHPLMMIGSDSILESNTPFMPDPRAYGVYPGIIEYYVKENNYLTLEEAVKKMTWLPAQRFNIRDRGLITEGNWADILIMDKNRIRSMSIPGPPEKANNPAIGINYIIVNGQITIDQGHHTGTKAGKTLRNQTR